MVRDLKLHLIPEQSAHLLKKAFLISFVGKKIYSVISLNRIGNVNNYSTEHVESKVMIDGNS